MPQAVAAAAAWIGNAIATAVITATGHVAFAHSIAFLTISTVSQAALIAGLSYVVDDVAHQKVAPQGQELQLRIDPDMAREMIIGERVVAGSMVARYSRGSSLYNAHFVYQLADHPCTELSRVYGDGRLVQSTALTHGTRTEITAYSYSGGARVWMTWHDGRPGQTVDSNLVTNSALDPDVVAGQILGWSSSHIGAGCAYVHIEVQYDSDILTSIPQFLFHVKGAPLYDRRLDTTAGGSGAHRIDDPSTWAYSTNAAVATDHYMLGYQVEDDPLAFGIGLRKSEVPYEQFAAAADLADEDVVTGVGGGEETIKRYAVNGIISAGDFFEEVLDAMQNQMAARIVDLGGRIGILGAEERTSVVTLDDDDWADDETVRFADKLPFSDLYGSVLGSFPDPANLYQPTQYERQVTSYLALPDGGEATAAQLDFPYEVHPRRAVRLASAWLARESLQPRLIGTFATRSLAWKLEPGDWFTMTSVRLQFTDQKFEVVDIVKHDDFTVTLTARAIDPDFLAFSVDDDPDLSVPPEVDPVDILLDEPTGVIAAVTLSGGGATEPALKFTLSTIDPLARELVIEVREWVGPGSEDFSGDPILAVSHSEQATTLIRAGIIPGAEYKARIKARAGFRESPWTAYSSAVTAGATYEIPTSGLASAIVGQGWGATASEAAARASRSLGLLKNALFQEEFSGTATPPQWSNWTNGTGTFIARPFGDGNCFKLAGGAGVNAGVVQQMSGIQASQDYLLTGTVRIESGSLTGAGVLIEWFDSGFGGLGNASIVFATDADSAGAVSSTPVGVHRWEKVVTAPSGAAHFNVYAMSHYSSLGSTASANELSWYNCDLIPMELVRQLRADVTLANTAAAITGQAAAATDSTIEPGATKNTLTFSASAPGSPTNGDIWVDTSTTPYVIKSRVSAAWQESGSYGGVFGSTIYEAGGGAVASLAGFKTILGTASAITSQGALATLNTVGGSQIDAASVTGTKLAFNNTANLILDPLFNESTSYWSLSNGFATSTSVEITGNLSKSKGVTVNGTGRASGSSSETTPAAASYAQVEPALAYRFEVAYRIKAGFTGRLTLGCAWYDQSKTLIGSGVTVLVGTDYRTSAAGSNSTGALTGFAVSPAGAAFVRYRLIVNWSSTLSNAGDIYLAAPVMFRPAQLGITLTLENGTTIATNVLLQTSLGTAAAIASQGTQATANHQRGASYSGTPVEGSWWADTSTDELKLYTGAAWHVVSSILPAGVAAQLSVDFPGLITELETYPTVPTAAETAVAAGGVSPYTYAWTKLSASGDAFTSSGGTGANFGATLSGAGTLKNGSENWQLKVTDDAGTIVYTNFVVGLTQFP